LLGHHKLLSEGAQIEGVVLENNTPRNLTKDRLRVAVKFDDGEKAEFTEDVTNYFEPGHGLKALAGKVTGNNVIPLALTPGSRIPVRYDPAKRKHLAIDVPALHEQRLQRWIEGQQESRAQAEAVLDSEEPAGQTSATHRRSPKSRAAD
jgi:hypothetical protein